jgi:putative transposase
MRGIVGWTSSLVQLTGHGVRHLTRSTTDGRTLKLLHVVDEHTREALAIRVARSIDADHTVRVLDQIVRERSAAPELVRMDGQRPRDDRQRPPRLVPLRRQRPQLHRARLTLAEPVRRVVRLRVRDEVLSGEAFDSVLEAQTAMNEWKNITTTGGHTAASAGPPPPPTPLA